MSIHVASEGFVNVVRINRAGGSDPAFAALVFRSSPWTPEAWPKRRIRVFGMRRLWFAVPRVIGHPGARFIFIRRFMRRIDVFIPSARLEVKNAGRLSFNARLQAGNARGDV
jgi:hypothetical protein